QRYEIEISPAPPAGLPSGTTTSTSYTFRGLTNGTEYSVRVRAVNNAPEPGDWSGSSAPQIPAAPPGEALDITATSGSVSGGTRQITVTWIPGASNGAPLTKHELQINGSTVERDQGTTSYTFEAVRGQRYDIAMRSANKAGWSPWRSTVGE